MRFTWDEAVEQGLVTKSDREDAIKQSESSPLNRAASVDPKMMLNKGESKRPKARSSAGLDVVCATLLPYDQSVLRQARDTQHYSSLCYLSRHIEEYESDQEHWDQVYIFHYMDVKYPQIWKLLHATPNAGQRSKRERGFVVSEGLKSGFPDMSLDMACGKYFGLRIELKRACRTPCSLSDNQREWLALLTESGYFAAVAFGFRDCIDIILEYFLLNPYNGKSEMKFRGKHSIDPKAIWRR